ncbi:MAG: magnesium transporter [Alphaproteobacteria bacterium]|nr:magnesium transporter [Alphaproteobacteria bacterium]MDX5368853.1 magnesium transporter [Alphaproteobacteria bacterium]MDX5463576.1 magnesium transporter [Alphaproteobacteria bacterium]
MADGNRLAFEEEDEGGATLGPRFVAAVVAALDAADGAQIRDLCAELHPADLADLIGLLNRDERRDLVALLGALLTADVLSELDEGIRDDVLDQLDPKAVAAAISELDTDDAVYLLEDLDPEVQQEILKEVAPEDRTAVEQGLQYPEGSAGRLMQRELIAVPSYWTVGQVIDYMRETPDLPDDFYELIVVDPAYKPVGTVALSDLLRSRRAVIIEDIADTDVETIAVETDQEDVAYRFEQYGLVSAPVVDDSGRLVGVIMVDDVVDIIAEEADEDIKRLGGVGDEDLSDTVVATTRYRFPWLVVNLATALLASWVISWFEGSIAQIVALAVLMPIVASMGGNAGTQSLTVAVRAIATKELTSLNSARVIWRETAVGLLNGMLFAVLMGAVAGFWFESLPLGLVMAAAMVINMLAAGLSGVLIPVALDRLKIDPAVASSVFVTTVTDVVGFFAFLGLAALVLL